MMLAHASVSRARLLGTLAAAAALAAAGLAWAGAADPGRTVAFERTWTAPACNNINASASQRGFFDDAPGAGGNNESAFFWANADDATNEYCVVASEVNLSSGVYRNASMRAAVNDNSILTTAFYAGTGCTGSLLGQLTISGADANSQFRDRSGTLSSGTIRSICIYIDDATHAHAQRISALIDQVRLADTSGAIGWQERFTKNG